MISLTLLFAASALAPTRGELEVTPETIASVIAEAVPVVEQELGLRFTEGGGQARIADRSEVERVLREENVPLMRVQFGEDAAVVQARAFAALIAPSVLAKFAFAENEILVVPEAFARVAEILGRPDLRSIGVLRGVLVHELVHAADQQLHGIRATYLSLLDADSMLAFNAVVEGHAQYVARRVCERLGWSEGFEVFSECTATEVGRESELSEGEILVARIQSASLVSAYTDGERFMTTIAREGGPEAVARAFAEPPAEMAVIHRPEWFLDPASRPAATVDLETGLDVFAQRHAKEGWAERRLSVDTAQLRAVFSLLSGEVVERIVKGLLQNRIVVLSPEINPAGSYVTMALYQWSTELEARFFQEAIERLQHIKDEAMSEGPVRIVEATYEKLDDGDLFGFVTEKKVAVYGSEVRAFSVIATAGDLSIELLFNGEPLERDGLHGRLRDVLRAVRRHDTELLPPPVPSEAGTER